MKTTKDKLIIMCITLVLLLSIAYVFYTLSSKPYIKKTSPDDFKIINQPDVIEDYTNEKKILTNEQKEYFASKTPMTYEERMGIEKNAKITKEYSDDEIEKIKNEIISGLITDVPADMLQTRNELIREYIISCYEIKNIEESLTCYEKYYLNNDQEFKSGIENCQGSTDCLDNFYYYVADNKQSQFCYRITDEDYKQKCLTTII